MTFVLFCIFITVATASATHGFAPLWTIRGGAMPSNDEDKPFYALGVNIARQVGTELKQILTVEEMATAIAGYTDSMKSLNSEAEEKKILSEHGATLNEIITKRALANLEQRKSEGSDAIVAFVAGNKEAVTTETGLVYWEEVTGSGKQPTAESTVEVHYHGTLMDGTVFDSSKMSGQPVQFPLDKVIKGWSEGVLRMKEGGKATLYLPSDLAYGDGGSPPQIPGGSALKFEIELISVVQQ